MKRTEKNAVVDVHHGIFLCRCPPWHLSLSTSTGCILPVDIDRLYFSVGQCQPVELFNVNQIETCHWKKKLSQKVKILKKKIMFQNLTLYLFYLVNINGRHGQPAFFHWSLSTDCTFPCGQRLTSTFAALFITP